MGSLAPIQSVNSIEQLPLGWLAHPMHFAAFGGTSSPQGYSPSQMRTAYGLPSSGGNGTTIAIVNAFDTPNILTYYDTFSNQYGLPDNSSGSFLVHKMAKNMQTDGRWTSETCLDVEWAHAIAPNATILLVEAVNPTNAALLSAVDYATSWPGVIAVSMSWGGDEFFNEASFDYHFNKPGITFFASSGDDGSTVMWPAASAIVVSVGGTTLNLNTDGTIISEIAWSNSSGGISSYIDMPPYQINFGLTHTKRVIPDVSYNGNASTGVAVYNGTWWKMGGTSAGAPQWAAIHALGQSATNTNLY
ncbi:MAG: peptidase S8/S53 subtilisin kexin sedolisin, partial [Ignavibacteria bacterium]